MVEDKAQENAPEPVETEDATGVEPAGDDANEVEIVSDEDTDGEAGDEAEEEVVLDPEEKVIRLEREVAEKHERLLRAMADMDNLRKRCRRDVEDAATRGRIEVLGELLPAVDSLDLALSSIDPDGGAKAVLEGMEMVRRQFLTSMERFGLKAVDAVGQAFDPSFHEAVSQMASDEFDAGAVSAEMRKGYVLKDRLVRASMVVVSTGKPEEVAGEETDQIAEEPPEEEAQADEPEVDESVTEETEVENGEEAEPGSEADGG